MNINNNVKFTSDKECFTYKNVKLSNLIEFLLILALILFLMVFNVRNVKADVFFTSVTSPGYGINFVNKSDGGNDYGYLPSYDGVLIRICAKKKGCDETNPDTYMYAIYTYKDSGAGETNNVSRTKPPYMGKLIKDITSKKFEIKGSLGLGYLDTTGDGVYFNGGVGGQVDIYFQENNFSNLESIIRKEAGLSKTDPLEKYYQKGDFVLVEPFTIFRVISEYGKEVKEGGTVNGLIQRLRNSGTLGGSNVGPQPTCPSNPCPTTYWLSGIITNMLTFRLEGYTDDNCSMKEDDFEYTSTNHDGCGFFRYNLDKLLDPPPSKGKIIIEKKDENGEPLGGATFGLYTDSGCSKLLQSKTTKASNGKVEFNDLDIKTYYYKEMAAPRGYDIGDNGKCRSVAATEKGTTKTVTNNKQKPKLKIKKVTKNANGNLVPATSIAATFNIYKTSNCMGIPVVTDLTTKKLVGESDEIELDKGIYYIKETGISPSNSGYEISKECKKIDLNEQSGTVIFEFENPKTCDSDLYELNQIKNQIGKWIYNKALVDLYTTYENKYNGLLNFDDPTCSNIACNRNSSFMCLNAEYETNTEFNENNISCYNSEFDYNGSKVYCLDTFELTNPLGAPKTWNVKSGQMIINKLDRIAAIGKVVRKCYFVDGNSKDYSPGKYSDYVSNLIFSEKLQLEDNSLVITKNSSNYYLEYSASTNYLLNPVYAKIGDGNISNTPSNNYNFIGYGVISKLNATKSYNIPFSITLGSKFSSKDKNFSSSDCKVNPIPELINPELRLEFRIIDTSNPFPGKSGSVRKVGTNWRYTNSTLFQNWHDNEFKNSSFYNKYKIQSSSDYGYNPYIAYIMETTNNSYNKNKTGPKYTIKLTPSDIRKIREYNKNHKYDDFTLKCVNGENCELSDEFKKVVTIKGI